MFGSQPLNYSVTVRGESGVQATGEVAISVDGRRVTTVPLDAQGRATVPITGLRSGIHVLTARYLGSDQVAASTSWPSLVLKF